MRELSELIGAVETAGASAAGPGFASRLALIEQLETDVLERLQYVEARAALPDGATELCLRAQALHARLESDNARVLSRLRERIRAGRYTASGLRDTFARYLQRAGGGTGYDALDLLVAGIFDAGEPAAERAVLEPDMVAYQPTPARAILALIERAQIRPSDVVYDLGSGLGRVVLLVALLTNARAVGIEFEPAFHDYAVRSACELGVARAAFVRSDARDAEFRDGSVFFLYTPFRGAMLQRVLERVREQTRGRLVRVATYGPCTPLVAETGWFSHVCGDPTAHDDLCVFGCGSE